MFRLPDENRFTCKHFFFARRLVLMICNRRAVVRRACVNDFGEEELSIVGEMTEWVGEKTQPGEVLSGIISRR